MGTGRVYIRDEEVANDEINTVEDLQTFHRLQLFHRFETLHLSPSTFIYYSAEHTTTTTMRNEFPFPIIPADDPRITSDNKQREEDSAKK